VAGVERSEPPAANLQGKAGLTEASYNEYVMTSSSKWIEGIGAQTSVADAARKSLGPRLAAVSHMLPMAAHLAEHDVEHVHRLRVATRRATAALKLYRECLDGKEARWMKKWLRKIRRAAGDARDLDVLADRLARDYGEPAAPVVELIGHDRKAVQPAIVEVANRCRDDDKLVRKTASLLQSIDGLKRKDDQESPHFADWAARQFAEVADAFAAAMPNESSTPAELHQFRISAKALRYVIELVAPAFGPSLREELYPTIEEVQERLGRVQDHVAAIERCRVWIANTRNSALQETLRELMEAEERGLKDSIREFHNWWNEERVANVSVQLEFPGPEASFPASPLEEVSQQT
jgi:CHAD domain-containing protein